MFLEISDRFFSLNTPRQTENPNLFLIGSFFVFSSSRMRSSSTTIFPRSFSLFFLFMIFLRTMTVVVPSFTMRIASCFRSTLFLFFFSLFYHLNALFIDRSRFGSNFQFIVTFNDQSFILF